MKKIIVDNSFFQTRILLTENGEPVEFFYESGLKKSLVGNIYAGKVKNILKGMSACFVDIGSDKNAYLPLEKEHAIKNGDTVIVQVEKDAFGDKGAVLTEKLSFVGKFVIIVFNDYNKKNIGISKKITDDNERDRISNIISNMAPVDCSVIVRTEGEGRSEEEFKIEIENIIKKVEIIKKAAYYKAPCVIFKEEDFVIKVLKNIFTSDIDEVVINNVYDYNNVKQIPFFDNNKITFYDLEIPIFENFYLESKLERIFNKKVWLKSGGFIIIEQTEACVVIDVNTGKFTGKKDIEETFLKTNIEAAYEAARQIRLRNLSGIIIIDFIDMKDEYNKKTLKNKLYDAVSKDRLKTNIVGMTELGLMQLTRKKGSLPVLKIIGRDCYKCNGNGFVHSTEYIAGKILREINSIFLTTMFKKVTVLSEKRVISFIKNSKYVEEMENKFKKVIQLKEIENLKQGYYNIEKEF